METTKRLKFVLIGEKHVGKRNLIATGFNKPRRASPLYIPIEFTDVELKYKNRIYTISCYDSLISSSNTGSNQNRIIDSLNAEAILNADALLLCYAGHNASSFQSLGKLYREFKYQNAPAYLVESKKDSDLRSSEQFNPSSLPINIVQSFRFPSVNKENIISMFQAIIDDIEERPYNPNQYTGQQQQGTTYGSYGYAQENQTYQPTEQVQISQNQYQQQQQQPTNTQQPIYTQQQSQGEQYRQPETPLNQNQQFEQARISQTESQMIPRSDNQQTPVKDSFASPDEKHSTKREVRYSDKKERIILMDGSYAKRLTVVDESKNVMERSTRVVQKNVKDAIVEKPDDY